MNRAEDETPASDMGMMKKGRIAAAMNDLRNKIINWVLVEKPAVAAKVIRRLTSSGSKRGKSGGTGTPAALPVPVAVRPTPLNRDNGLRAANVAAGVPGAE